MARTQVYLHLKPDISRITCLLLPHLACSLPLHPLLHLYLLLQGTHSLAIELQDKCSSLAEAEARFSQLEQMMQRIVARGGPLGAAGLGVMR